MSAPGGLKRSLGLWAIVGLHHSDTTQPTPTPTPAPAPAPTAVPAPTHTPVPALATA